MTETTSQLGERIARLEALQKTAAERAAEDRAQMKEALAEVREDIAAVNKSVGEVTDTLKSAVDQITGGRKVLHALWIVGGIVAGVMAWASGMLQKLGLFVVR